MNHSTPRLFFSLIVLGYLLMASPAFAATINVNTFSDELINDGDCSLREAIQAANNNNATYGCTAGQNIPVIDEIVIPAGTYTLTIAGINNDTNTTGDLDITQSVTLTGAGAGSTVIQAGAVAHAGIDRVIHITGGVSKTVAMRHLTIQNGCAGNTSGACNSGGGGIEANASGTVTVENCTIQGNRGNSGGGIHPYTPGSLTLTVRDSVIQNNVAQIVGGGISNYNNTVVERSLLYNNGTTATGGGNGGGIGTSNGVFTVRDSAIYDNTASGNGAGISVQGTGASSTFFGTLILTNTTLSGNRANAHGGGIYINGGSTGGTGVSVYGCPTACNATLHNVTAYANVADFDGTGMAGNGGGVYVNNTGTTPGTFTTENSIIAGNTDNTGGVNAVHDVSGPVNSLNYNLIQRTVGLTWGAGSPANGDLTGAAPVLAALADNGGNTQTHALSAGPGLDAGNPAGCADGTQALATDQRGLPRTQNGRCDMGAYELQIVGVCGDGTMEGSEQCDDSNTAGGDGCSATCQYETGVCDDGNACTTGETWVSGVCSGGSALICNDSNECTTDSCNQATGCVYSNNTNSCSDGNACTTGDTCSAGACAGGVPLSCEDGNGCTADSCNPVSGCAHSNNTNSCDDGNACTTNDACSAGSCAGGTPLSCNDGNGCTDDSCNPTTGCQHSDNTNSCSDGNACTTNDSCSGGSCAGGAPLGCNDNNGCTDDSCNPISGCVYSNNIASCDDGNACNSPDQCGGGICSGSSSACGNGTLEAGCSEECDDGNTAGGDGCDSNCQNEPPPPVCGNGALEAGEACDDGNILNGDCCNSLCDFEPADSSCDDANVCTATDTCSGDGICSGAGSTCGNSTVEAGCNEECDDGGLENGDGCNSTCHDEYCGDASVNNGGTEQCDDGNLANGDGCDSDCQIEPPPPPVCGNGAVEAGEACDGGACCSPTCEFSSASTVCDDGNACTVTDACNGAGACTGSGSPCGNGTLDAGCNEACDDGNTLGGDCCSATCQFEPSGSVCNDNNICTATDTCDASGACSGSGSTCGNGAVNASCGEQCDDSNTMGGDGCNATCQNEYCGDGSVNDNGLEQCDDGNTASGDGCSATCQAEIPPTVCGNGTCEEGETPANCSADCGGPNLRIQSSPMPANPGPGQTVVITLTYSNIGTAPATGVVITADIPMTASAFSTAGSSPTVWSCANGTVPGNLCTTAIPGTLAPGATGSVRFAVTYAGYSRIYQTSTIRDDGSHGTDTDITDNGVCYLNNQSYKSINLGPTRTPANISHMLVPNSYNGTQDLPLLLLMHGLDSQSYSGQLDGQYNYRFSEAVQTRGYFLILGKGTGALNGGPYTPSNPRPHWNATDACCSTNATTPVGQLNPATDVNDVAYLRGIIEEAQARVRVDSHRIYASGFSNGAFMSYRLACEMPDVLAAIAPVSGLTYQNEASCIGTEPVSVLHINGTADVSIPFYDVTYTLDPDNNPATTNVTIPERTNIPGAQETANRWAAKAGCDPTSALLPNVNFVNQHNMANVSPTIVVGAGNETIVHSYQNCDPGYNVELWEVPLWGHGGYYNGGSNPTAATQILDWLFAHPKP